MEVDLGGRPLKFETVEELEAKIEEYFKKPMQPKNTEQRSTKEKFYVSR